MGWTTQLGGIGVDASSDWTKTLSTPRKAMMGPLMPCRQGYVSFGPGFGGGVPVAGGQKCLLVSVGGLGLETGGPVVIVDEGRLGRPVVIVVEGRLGRPVVEGRLGRPVVDGGSDGLGRSVG